MPDRSLGRASGPDAARQAARKEGHRSTAGDVHHLVELAYLVPGPDKKGSLGAIGRAEVGAAMPESLDLLTGRALPFSVPSSNRERKNAVLEMIDLLGQLAALAAIVAGLAGARIRGGSGNDERQRQSDTDEEADMGARATGKKLHTGTIGPGMLEL